LQLASGLAAVRSYEAERQRIDELAALDRAKSLLFSNVSHELRTPLTLVAGPLDDLVAETPDGPKKENLIMARRNVYVDCVWGIDDADYQSSIDEVGVDLDGC
jgi:signal transduction histidine kinase